MGRYGVGEAGVADGSSRPRGEARVGRERPDPMVPLELGHGEVPLVWIVGSSEESMGELGLGKSSKCVVAGDLGDFEGSVPIRLSAGQFQLVIQTLHGGCRFRCIRTPSSVEV